MGKIPPVHLLLQRRAGSYVWDALCSFGRDVFLLAHRRFTLKLPGLMAEPGAEDSAIPNCGFLSLLCRLTLPGGKPRNKRSAKRGANVSVILLARRGEQFRFEQVFP